MPVVGISITSVKAVRDREISGALKVNNNAEVKGVEERELGALGKGAAIGFEFSSKYSGNGKAEISITGEVYFIGDVPKLLKTWKKEGKLPKDVNVDVINAILRKCLVKAISLSEELQLPPPVPLPLMVPPE